MLPKKKIAKRSCSVLVSSVTHSYKLSCSVLISSVIHSYKCLSAQQQIFTSCRQGCYVSTEGQGDKKDRPCSALTSSQQYFPSENHVQTIFPIAEKSIRNY